MEQIHKKTLTVIFQADHLIASKLIQLASITPDCVRFQNIFNTFFNSNFILANKCACLKYKQIFTVN